MYWARVTPTFQRKVINSLTGLFLSDILNLGGVYELDNFVQSFQIAAGATLGFFATGIVVVAVFNFLMGL